MEKVICDICGTAFPETEDCCPVCGCSKDTRVDMDLELEEEDLLQDSPILAARRRVDAVDAYRNRDDDDDDEDDDDDDDDDEDSRRGGTGVVILLVVLIMLLLAVAGFLFVRYVLPNLDIGQTEPTQIVLETEAPVETTTEPGIPCQQLVLTSGSVVDMTREGEYKLIHVMVKPEDTTDKLTYVSSDENIVTVTDDGRITAVSEGEATITIVCGNQRMECRVFVHFVEETEPTTEPTTVPPTEETVPEDTSAEETQETEAQEETTPAEETEAQEETQPTEQETESTEPAEEETEPAEEETVPETTDAQLKDVTLKLGRTDVSLNVGYSFTIPLECDLEYSEIEWSTGNAGIAVIKDGVITALAKGTTQLFAKYGDQTVTGWIRVR